MPCPHPYGLKVPSPDGDCYACLKSRATNGHRSKLSLEQLRFVGFEPDTEPTEPEPRWLPPAARHERIDKQLEELARLKDVAPNWLAFARALIEDEKEKS